MKRTKASPVITVPDSESSRSTINVMPRRRSTTQVPMPAYQFKVGDIPKLSIECGKNGFTTWRERWYDYVDLSGLGLEEHEKQARVMRFCMDDETYDIVRNSGLEDDERGHPQLVLQVLQNYFFGTCNIFMERSAFQKRKQHAGESVKDYVIALRRMAAACEFCDEDCKKKAITTQLIEGTRDKEVVRELLKAKKLTMEDAVQIAKSYEQIKTESESIRENSNMQALDKKLNQDGSSQKVLKCQQCGWSHKPDECPAKNQKCKRCERFGHFMKMCKTKNLKKNENNSVERSMNRLNRNEDDPPAPKITVTCTGKISCNVDMLPDTGADMCAADKNFVEKIGLHNMITSTGVCPKAINGEKVNVIGKVHALFQLKDKQSREEIFIFDHINCPVLSWMACKRLGLIPMSFPEPIDNPHDHCQIKNQINEIGKTDFPKTDFTKESLIKEFPRVFDGVIRMMPGETFKIELKNDAQPFCVNTPRNVPLPLKSKLKDELDLLEEQGIIAKQTKPTPWCAPIVVAPKKNSEKIRLCIDFTKLNKFVERERYMSNTPAEAVLEIKNSNFFSVFDAVKGYHQCELDEESQDITTFITPFGRYKYKRAPYGVKSISEHYNRRMDECFHDLNNLAKIVDDCLIHDETLEEHHKNVRKFLKKCEEKQVSLNPDKMQVCLKQVRFGGYDLCAEGYSLSKDITRSIEEFPSPDSRKTLRGYFGLANQLAANNVEVGRVLEPLRGLLTTKNDFIWTKNHEVAFVKSKKALVKPMLNAYFDVQKSTRLCTDASRTGLGFILQQKHERWKTVQTGSRFLTDAESRYAVVELEMLGVAWAVHKCRYFLSGLHHFEIVTDHSPLVPILNSHRLDEIENPRLQRLRTRIMGYSLTAKHIKGIENDAPDALSRSPTDRREKCEEFGELEPFEKELAPNPKQVLKINAASYCKNLDEEQVDENLHMTELRIKAANDQEYIDLRKVILEGFPNHKGEMKNTLKKFWRIKEHLTVDDELILHGCRLFIPYNLRAALLNRMHEAHQGIIRMQARARLTFYWPGIDEDIEHFVTGCKHCQNWLPQHAKEPLIQKQRPTRPFQEVAMDFAEKDGLKFLIVVDCMTDWPDIFQFKNSTNANELIRTTRELFCRTAVPDTIWSDQGTNFMSESFQNFLKEWGVLHKTSSPRHPQSNGKAEATVKSMKKIIEGAMQMHKINEDKLARALLQYRNTPTRRDGLSPAQKLFGHPIQDNMPIHRKAFDKLNPQGMEDAQKKADKNKSSQKRYYDQHVKTLDELDIGQSVAVYNNASNRWDILAVVMEKVKERRYMVKTSAGKVLTRNRKFLRKRKQNMPDEIHEEIEQSSEDVPEYRKSTRQGTKTKRLVEDENWC